MRFEQLLYLHEIGQYKSISKAGERLYVTQPTLSRSIKALEDELGVELLVRTPNGVKLTPAAENLLPFVTEILNNIASLKEQAKLQNIYRPDFSEFTLNVLTTPNLVDTYLVDVLEQFYKLYPIGNVRINVGEMDHIQRIAKIYDNQIIIVKIMPDTQLNTHFSLGKDRLTFHKICEEAQIAILRKDNPLGERPYLLLEEAYAQKLVLNLNGIDMPPFIKRVINSKQELDILLQSNNSETIKSTILSQDAVYIANSHLQLKYDFSQDEFCTVPIYRSAREKLYVDIYAVYNDNSPLKYWIESFLQMFKEIV